MTAKPAKEPEEKRCGTCNYYIRANNYYGQCIVYSRACSNDHKKCANWRKTKEKRQ